MLIVIKFEIEELILKVKFIKSIDNLGGKSNEHNSYICRKIKRKVFKTSN